MPREVRKRYEHAGNRARSYDTRPKPGPAIRLNASDRNNKRRPQTGIASIEMSFQVLKRHRFVHYTSKFRTCLAWVWSGRLDFTLLRPAIRSVIYTLRSLFERVFQLEGQIVQAGLLVAADGIDGVKAGNGQNVGVNAGVVIAAAIIILS